ncbi:MAG: hypothetical protein PHP64_07535 [Actinomycetota bacterium]|nr:hypothetical protein [Actinomycetota bacterium]
MAKFLRPRKLEALFFSIYAGITVYLTWPLVTKFNSSLYGGYTDNVGTIWGLWWIKNASKFKSIFPAAKTTFCPLIGAPFGSRLSGLFLEPVAEISERILLRITNEVFVYNFFILISFFLAGITMYFLIRHITKNRLVAFFGGLAYLTCTFHAYHSMSFIRIAQIQWMPLFLLMLLKFMEKPDSKRAIYLGLSAILVGGTCIHYGLFMLIFTLAFLLGRFLHKYIMGGYGKTKRLSAPFHKYDCIRSPIHTLPQRSAPSEDNRILEINKKTLMLSLCVFIAFMVVMVTFGLSATSNINPPGRWPTSTTAGEVRNTGSCYWGSAFPKEYILPSPFNPYLGWITDRLTGNTRPWANSLYLGWSLILLSIFALIFAYRKRPTINSVDENENEFPQSKKDDSFSEGDSPAESNEKGEKSGRKYIPERSMLWGFAIAFLVCLIFSFPPFMHIGSIKIYLPSVLYRIFAPWLRWYLRMGMVVFLGIVILGSIGLNEILSRINRKAGLIIAVILSVIIFMEMLIVPPFPHFDFKKIPDVYEELSKLPQKTIVAFYPMLDPGFFDTNLITFYQRWFRIPMLNGAPGKSDGEALRRTVYNPYTQETAGILKRFGIEKVVFLRTMFAQYEGHIKDLKITEEELVDKLPSGFVRTKSFTYKEDESFGNADILEVRAKPADIVPIYMGDITVPHMDVGLVTVRIIEKSGLINLVNYVGRDVVADIDFDVRNVVEAPHRLYVIHEKLLRKVSLKGSETAKVNLKDIVIPKEGLKLNLVVEGSAVSLSPEESRLYGRETGTLALGETRITVKK